MEDNLNGRRSKCILMSNMIRFKWVIWLDYNVYCDYIDKEGNLAENIWHSLAKLELSLAHLSTSLFHSSSISSKFKQFLWHCKCDAISLLLISQTAVKSWIVENSLKKITYNKEKIVYGFYFEICFIDFLWSLTTITRAHIM